MASRRLMKESLAWEVEPGREVWAANTEHRLSVSTSFCCIFTYSCLSRARCFCNFCTSSAGMMKMMERWGARRGEMTSSSGTQGISTWGIRRKFTGNKQLKWKEMLWVMQKGSGNAMKKRKRDKTQISYENRWHRQTSQIRSREVNRRYVRNLSAFWKVKTLSTWSN